MEPAHSGFLQWGTVPRDISGPDQDLAREEILTDALRFTAFGVQGNWVILKVPSGPLLMETRDQLVWFEFAPRAGSQRLIFWMNKSSVQHLVEALQAADDKRQPFLDLFLAQERA